MSTTIDQRVVEMRFDNKHFERNVSTTMSTLDKLKKSLDLKGASKGLEEVGTAAKKCDVSVIGTAAEKVGLKFSAMYTIADQALRNITNSAMNAGKRIVSALTIDPIKTGFSEYETQINAIQTILANTESKGTTLEDVNGALDELNAYADKTIYNFTEMTRNIGTFTAAGTDLDTSVKAIQGIANLAAVSGSNSQQASTAMYQLSQAMASGTVKLMDWNSVVNAGMGGQVFQDALKATAKVHGVAIDEIIEKNGSFRESLSEGWLTTEILTDTLEKFTMYAEEGSAEWENYKKTLMEKGYTAAQAEDILKMGKTATEAATKVKTFTQLFDTLKEAAQSGWTQTWEILVGDFEEAKELLTSISDVVGGFINKMSESRNELLENWKVMGGRDDLLDSFKNIWDALLSVIKPIKEAFSEIFPPTTAEQLVGLTKGLKEFTAKLKLSDTASENLKRTFKGLFAVLDIVGQIFSAIFKAVGSLFGTFTDLGGGILGVTATFGDWLVGLSEGIRGTDIFSKVLQGVVRVIKFVTNTIKKLFSGIKTIFSSFGDAASIMGDGVTTAVESMGSALENCSVFKLLKTLWKGIKAIASGIVKAVSALASGFGDALGASNFGEFLDIINSVIAGGLGISLVKFFKSFEGIFDGVSDGIENVTSIFGSLSGVLEGYQTKLKADALIKIAGAIAILTASVLVLSLIDSDKLYDSIIGLTLLFASLTGTMVAMSKFIGETKGLFKLTTSMVAISIAVLILSSALKTLSGLDIDELMTGLLGVAGLMTIVVGTAKVLSSGGQAVIKGATQMVIFAAALKLMASVCEDLAYFSWEELGKGIAGIAGMTTVIVIAAKVLSSGGQAVIKGATQIVIFAAALKILASVCDDLSSFNWKELGKGLLGIAALTTMVVAAIKILNSGSGSSTIKGATQIVIFAASIKILASACEDFGRMSWETVARGLIGMAGALAAITIALKLIPKNMVGLGVGMIAVSTALVIMANALDKMGGMSWEAIAKGLVTLGGSVVILAVGLNIMKGTLGGSAAMLVAAAALAVLTPILKTLGSMSWGSIAKGLITIAGAFAVIGIGGLLLKPVIPAILGLAGALFLVGVSVLAAGAGLAAAGAGLTALATGLTALAGSLTIGVSAIVGLVSATVTGIIKGIGEGILALCDVIISGAPAIGEALTVLVLTLCDVLSACVPQIADTLLKLVVALLDSLSEHTPKIVESLFDFVIGVLDGFADNIPRLIQSIVDIIMSVFEGVVNALGSIDIDTLLKGIAGVGLMAGVMAALAAVSTLIPAAMLGALGMGAVIAELAIVLAAVGALAQIPGLEWLVGEGGRFMQTVGTAIGQFIGGIAGGIAQGFTNSLPQIGADLSTFMTNLKPFIEGASLIDPSVVDGVKSLVNVILAITGASLLESITSWVTGGSSITSFAEELPILGQGLKGFSDSVAGIVPENIIAASNAAKALAEMTAIIPNEGGVVSWFTGENSIAKFGSELPILGQGLKGFSDAVAGIIPENVTSAASAAKTLAEMTSVIPNEGGMAAWFTGENSISKFASDIVTLGYGLKGFSDAVIGVVPENIVSAASAAKALAEMTAIIPNEGGIKAWFTGENSITKFASDIVSLGYGLKGFSDAVTGVVPENVLAGANAAKALAEMTAIIPNEGGIVAWFTGESSISKFAGQLPILGRGLKGFSDAIAGIVPENVTAAANAAKSLAQMTAIIPSEGGVKAWFTGESSISKFGSDLTSLGKGIKGFSDAVAGIAPETVTSGANAAKTLAEMTAIIPNEGGIKAWFTGESSISNFAGKLPALGKGLKGFSDSVAGINPEALTAAANAATALAEMTQHIPKEGGIKAWFTGESSISNFAGKLPALGKGLKGFSDSVKGISPENVTAAANAAKSLAQMTDTVPKDTSKITSFGTNLETFGSKLASYFEKTKGITSKSASASSEAIKAVKEITTIDTGKITSVSTALDKVTKSIKNLAKVPGDTLSGLKKSLKTLGETSADAFVKEFEKIDDDMKDAGKDAVTAFQKGADGGKSKATGAFKKIAEACAKALSGKKNSFKSAGKALVQGFADGISANTYLAEAKAKAMANAAEKAAKEALDINSPSKVFMGIGEGVPEGFAMGVDNLGRVVKKSVESMTDDSIDGVKNSISRIADLVNTDIDSQPSIRPVLDLSDVRKGAGAINNMLGGSSVDLLANVGAIGFAMDQRNQNGVNDDVVSAIDKLNRNLENGVGDTYNFGNISYDDESTLAEAVHALVRAAIRERRV